MLRQPVDQYIRCSGAEQFLRSRIRAVSWQRSEGILKKNRSKNKKKPFIAKGQSYKHNPAERLHKDKVVRLLRFHPIGLRIFKFDA